MPQRAAEPWGINSMQRKTLLMAEGPWKYGNDGNDW